MQTITTQDGAPLAVGDFVDVQVGSGSVLRPGVVVGIGKMNVKVTFQWGNGRITEGRAFAHTSKYDRPLRVDGVGDLPAGATAGVFAATNDYSGIFGPASS